MRPELQFSILCDDVRQEKNGKFIFVGTFNLIAVPKFPVLHSVFFIANQWCAGEGEYKEQSRIVDDDNRVVVTSPEITFNLKDFYATHFVISRFHNMKLERPGKYSVEVLLNGELFRRFPFNVIQAKEEATA